MLQLVIAIEKSPYAAGLFAWQSHWDLFIAQTYIDGHLYNGPRLKISPTANSCEKVEFRYIDTLDEAKQWHRVVDGADAFARLESFIQQLNWFTDYKLDSNPERRETR